MQTKLVMSVLTGLALGLQGCEDAAATAPGPTPASGAQIEQFQARCDSLMGVVNRTACNGTAVCAGLYLDLATGGTSRTSCKGTNSCKGLQCVDIPDSTSASAGRGTGTSP